MCSLPHWWCLYSHLHSAALSASSNELTEVPDLLLRELLTLGLSHNAIAAVPQPRFGRELCDRFPQLQALDLSHNRLAALPCALASLRSLRELRLECNQLESLLPCLAPGSSALAVWPYLATIFTSAPATCSASTVINSATSRLG